MLKPVVAVDATAAGVREVEAVVAVEDEAVFNNRAGIISGVEAEAAVDMVVPLPSAQVIVTVVAVDLVVAVAAVQRIAAGLALEIIIAAAAGDDVVALGAFEDFIPAHVNSSPISDDQDRMAPAFPLNYG